MPGEKIDGCHISIKKELFARGAKWFLWKSEVFGETAGWGTDKAAKWL